MLLARKEVLIVHGQQRVFTRLAFGVVGEDEREGAQDVLDLCAGLCLRGGRGLAHDEREFSAAAEDCQSAARAQVERGPRLPRKVFNV